jgi:hypothetical protein
VILDRERVGPDQMLAKRVDSGLDHLCVTLEHRFSPPDHTFVRLDPQEEPARRCKEGLDPDDLHRFLACTEAGTAGAWPKSTISP